MSVDSERERQDWFRFGGIYFEGAAKLLNASGSAPPIVHLAWQAVENDMKSLAVGHGNIPITHNLGHLMNHLRDSNVLTPTDLSQLSSDMAIVSGSRTYNDARYPENNPSYWYALPREQVTEVVLAAERIHKFTQTKIGLSDSAEAWWPHKSANNNKSA